MKVALFLLLTPFALVACGGAPTEPSAPDEVVAQDSTPAPKAWFDYDREEHDFGSVYAQSIQVTTFDLVTAGEDDLVAIEIVRSCGCTEGELFVGTGDEELVPFELDKPYPPGTHITLKATLNTRGKEGAQDQLVTVKLADQSFVVFHLKANIDTFLVGDPTFTDITGVKTLYGRSKTIKFHARGGERFAMSLKRNFLSEHLEVNLEPVDPDEQDRALEWVMKARILPGIPPGKQRLKLLLDTDVLNETAPLRPDGTRPFHFGEYWIRAAVEGVMEVAPDRLNLGQLFPDREAVARVSIRCTDRDFDLSEIKVGLFSIDSDTAAFEFAEFCTLTAAPIDPNRAFEVILKMKDVPFKGQFNGALVIKVDHPLQERVRIPFTAVGGGTGEYPDQEKNSDSVEPGS